MNVPDDPLIDLPGIAELLPEWTPEKVAATAYKHPELIADIARGWEEVQVSLYVLAIVGSNKDAAMRRGERDMMRFAAALRGAEAEAGKLFGNQCARLAKLANLVAGRPT